MIKGVKHFIEPPFNYTGSKYKLLEQLLPEMDYSKIHFCDLFCGGGSVYSNIIDKYEAVIVNDIISDLIGIHESLSESDLIIEVTKNICGEVDDKESFVELRKSYNGFKEPAKLWALMLSSTNNMLRFNKKFEYNQTYGNRSWNKNTDFKVEKFVKKIRKYKEKLIFTSKRFDEINIESEYIMFYLDPPYMNTGAGYNAYWSEEDELKLYNYIKNVDKIGSSFMLSGVLIHGNNSSNLLNKLITDGYNYKELICNYNKVSRIGNKEVKEIIIKNY